MSDQTATEFNAQHLLAEYRQKQFDRSDSLHSPHKFAQAARVWGEHEGNDTPHILLIALDEGHWDYSETTRPGRTGL